MKLTGLLFCAGLMMTGQANGQELKMHVDAKGHIGFVDANGNEVIKCLYENAQPFSNGVAIVTKSGKMGIIDQSGNIVLPLKYDQISPWTNELYLIKAGKTMGLVDLKGNIILEPLYSNISKPNIHGVALISSGGKATNNDKKTYMANAKYGIIDSHGKILISPIHKGLFEFSYDGTQGNPYHEGKRLEYSYHYTTDTLITDCQYLGFSNNGTNIYKAGIMDRNGNELLKSGLYDFVMQPQNDMVRYYITQKKETKFGYHDLKSGNSKTVASGNAEIGNIKYWSHGDFTGEIAPVNGTTWSFIDKSFNVVRQGYKAINHSIALGLWSAQKEDGTWEVFDDANKTVSELSGYSSFLFPAHKDDQQIFVVKKGERFGAINRNGETIIPFEYESACANSYDFIPLKTEKGWGIHNINNEQVIPDDFINIVLPIEKNAKHFWVQKSDSLYYHFNVSTNSVAKTGFKAVSNFQDGLAHVTPQNLELAETQVNKSQVYLPNTAQSTIAATVLDKLKNLFGIIINTEDVVVFDKPVSIHYISTIKKKISEHGNTPLTESEKKKILLEVTRDNRNYDLQTIISEDNWDY